MLDLGMLSVYVFCVLRGYRKQRTREYTYHLIQVHQCGHPISFHNGDIQPVCVQWHLTVQFIQEPFDGQFCLVGVISYIEQR